MRFCGEITREMNGIVRLRLSARAFHSKARSHDPITTPGVTGEPVRTTPDTNNDEWRALTLAAHHFSLTDYA